MATKWAGKLRLKLATTCMDFVCAMSMYKVTWQLAESSQQLLDAQHLVYRLNFAKAIR